MQDAIAKMQYTWFTKCPFCILAMLQPFSFTYAQSTRASHVILRYDFSSTWGPMACVLLCASPWRPLVSRIG
jgi:hypothetical protein